MKIYGLGERDRDANLEFCPISVHQFIEDLASCRAVLCNAGNQLVGEALYLEKPVFVLPEERNFEQEVNAHFLAREGTGTWCRVKEFSVERFNQFLNQLEEYRSRIDRNRLNGAQQTLQVIEKHLAAATAKVSVSDGHKKAKPRISLRPGSLL